MGRRAIPPGAVGRSAVDLAPVGSFLVDLPRIVEITNAARRIDEARELAHAAARAGLIELAPKPHDKRILQALLTPRGRSEVAAVRAAERVWLATLLNGLGDQPMAAATQVVRVARQRLERRVRELAQRKTDTRDSREP